MLNIFPAVISSKIPSPNSVPRKGKGGIAIGCDRFIKSGSRLAFMVEIDTTRDDTTINDDFIEVYHAMKKRASVPPKGKKDDHSLMVDPWEAYKLYHQYGSVAEATRKRFNIDNNSNDYESRYHQVDRAIKKAQELLDEFEQG